jgi:hypothetical protein
LNKLQLHNCTYERIIIVKSAKSIMIYIYIHLIYYIFINEYTKTVEIHLTAAAATVIQLRRVLVLLYCRTVSRSFRVPILRPARQHTPCVGSFTFMARNPQSTENHSHENIFKFSSHASTIL